MLKEIHSLIARILKKESYDLSSVEITSIMRTKLSSICFFLLFILSCFTIFAQNVNKSQTPNWVKEQSFPLDASPKKEAEGGVYYLLVDKQENINQKSAFQHYSYKILTSSAIVDNSDISISFDPSYQKLEFYKLIVYRGEQVIDKLASSQIKTIQRESSMERNLYDGSVTAVIHLDDIRKGDIIEYSFARIGEHPGLKGIFSFKEYLQFNSPVEKIYYRVISPKSIPLQVKYYKTEQKAKIQTDDRETEYSWELNKVDARFGDSRVPNWYDNYPFVSIHSMKYWEEIVTWAKEHYIVDKNQKEQLKRNVEAIIGPNPDIDKIIRFVQDDIRYLGFESGLNAFKPHPPTQVLEQRFGDCKDKSLLLIEILKAFDINAYPALVNTNLKSNIEAYWISPNVFDHCIVYIEGNKKFIDPTISNQGGQKGDYFLPDYGMALIIKEGQKDLTKIEKQLHSRTQVNEEISVSDLDGNAYMYVQTQYFGGNADQNRSYFSNNSLDEISRQYEKFYTLLYPYIKASETISVDDNRDENILTVTEYYKIDSIWVSQSDLRSLIQCEFYPLALEEKVNLTKDVGRASPYALEFPLDYSHEIKVKMPMDLSIEDEETTINTEYYSYNLTVSLTQKNELLLKHHYKTNSDHVPVANIGQMVRDHQQIMKKLSYSISYNKGLDYINNGGISWYSVLWTLTLFIIASIFAIKIYNRYNPEVHLGHLDQINQIGGWLILIGIGLVISPLRISYDIMTYPEMFNSQTWSVLYATEQFVALGIMVYEAFFNTFSLVFSILILVLFFQKRSSFPVVFSYYLAIGVILYGLYTAGFIWFSGLEVDEETQTDLFKTLFQRIGGAAIWIPYMNFSERAKSTFTVMK